MVLAVEDLNIFVGDVPLVQRLNLTVGAGETHCLVGQSGSGKTLSGLAVMGLLADGLRQSAAKIELDGVNLGEISGKMLRSLRGKAMSMIFQEPLSALNPVQTVGAQVAEMFVLHTPLTKQQRKQEVLKLFEQVYLPDPELIYGAYPHQLSGGQRQRVMIAMALALKPKLLIADEPTTALDAHVQGEILDLIKDLQVQCGTSVLFITHDFGVVERVGDVVTVLHNGKVVEQGGVADVLKAPKQDYTKRLLAARPIMNMCGKGGSFEKSRMVLKADNLQKTYVAGGLFNKRTVKALQDVNVQLRKGETLGVVGQSGSGKSTLVKCILQLETPDAGQVILNDEHLVGKKRAALRKAWRNIQMVFQDPASSLNPRQTVGASIAEGLKAHGIGTAQEQQAKVEHLLQQVGLEAEMAGRYPHQFSGGQRQRIGIARALALEPDVIVFDEAVAALDVLVQKDILALLEDLQAKLGLSYIFITHDLRVVSQIADTLMVLHAGQVVDYGTVGKVLSNPAHGHTKQLLAAQV